MSTLRRKTDGGQQPMGHEYSIVNKTDHFVRQRSLVGVANQANDRRVRRTTQGLTHALVALVDEKRYDAITIQDLLDRADVGRSTFYSHYRSKDDLLLKSFERLLDRLDQAIDRDDPTRGRMAPVRELFGHVGKFRSFHKELIRVHMLDRLYQTGTNQLSRTVARRLAALPHTPGAVSVPAPIVARAHAGALFALLRWWVEHDTPYSPERMDQMLHAMRLNR